MTTAKAFVETAFQKLIQRGWILPEQLTQSPNTEQQIAAFEQKYNIKIPKRYIVPFYFLINILFLMD